MGELGGVVEPVAPAFDAERLWAAWLVLRGFAMAARLGALAADPEKRKLLKPEAVWEVESGAGLAADAGAGGERRPLGVVRLRAALFERFDALALPSAQVFPFDAGWTWPREVAGRPMATYHQWMEVVTPATLAGLPALSVPVGFSDAGLPMGMQLVGRRGDDLGVLQLAEAYHRATDWPGRRPPRL